MNIIAISGKLCSGKTTLANGIIELDPMYKRLSLAAPIKTDIASLVGVEPIFIDQNKDRFRAGMQWYGTDVMRWLYGEDYWVGRLLDYAASCDFRNIIVDDVRFPNELEKLRDVADGFMSIRLLIDTPLQSWRYSQVYGGELTPQKMMHASETSLDDYPDFDQLLNAAIQREFLAKLAYDAMTRRGLAGTLKHV